MKTFLLVLIIGFSFIVAPGYSVYAQSSKKNAESTNERDFMPSIRKLARMENPALTRNYVNVRAIRDFLNRFDKVDNAMWYSTPDGGFEAYFEQNGYGDRILYDKKGRWKFSLINYGEDKLPRSIRTAVKSTYFDLDITLVEEVQTIANIDYIVYLEDKSNIRIVRVNKDGDIEVLQELDK
jgi:hypothetical protein